MPPRDAQQKIAKRTKMKVSDRLTAAATRRGSALEGGVESVRFAAAELEFVFAHPLLFEGFDEAADPVEDSERQGEIDDVQEKQKSDANGRVPFRHLKQLRVIGH